MERILVVEDEKDIQDIIKAFLENAQYEVVTADDGVEGIEKFKDSSFNLVILDIMLPKINGFVVCEMIRRQSKVPIIMLTALDDEEEQLKGFELLADDYITKPFSLKLLLKRVEAVLRRYSKEAFNNKENVIQFADVKLDKNAVKAYVNDAEIELTAREFKLLEMLIENSGKVLTRDSILNSIWGYDFYGDARVVDTHIKNVRRKLGKNYIETIRGVGYRLEQNK